MARLLRPGDTVHTVFPIDCLPATVFHSADSAVHHLQASLETTPEPGRPGSCLGTTPSLV